MRKTKGSFNFGILFRFYTGIESELCVPANVYASRRIFDETIVKTEFAGNKCGFLADGGWFFIGGGLA